MITLELLQDWIAAPVENENLEFKEAKNQFNTVKLLKYCVAIANEGGGYLIFGVTDKRPRQVVGSQAFSTPESLNKVKSQIVEKLRLRVDTTELQHPDGRVLVFEIPTRPTGQPKDFLVTGTSVAIEMYSDRVEISNPGIPPIQVERFIDEYRSRNEQLADLMRRFGICEEKGSGIDKVIDAVEAYQLPAPDFRVGEVHTTSILFAHQDFDHMRKADRIRACYQHCCLLYINNQRMSNQSLRERFRLNESKTATVSLIIGATKEAELIKMDVSESMSTRYARYLPFWA